MTVRDNKRFTRSSKSFHNKELGNKPSGSGKFQVTLGSENMEECTFDFCLIQNLPCLINSRNSIQNY